MNYLINNVDSICSEISINLTQKTEEIIAEAINRILGTEWNISDLTNRIEVIKIQGDNFETIYLDNKPILMLYDIIQASDYKEFNFISYKRSYKFLN